jgi:hypothetical protein
MAKHRDGIEERDRATYLLALNGGLTDMYVPMVADSVARLQNAGLIIRGKDGVYRTASQAPGVNVGPPSRLAPPAPPKDPPKVTVGVRLEADLVAALDARAEADGKERSTVVRDILHAALEPASERAPRAQAGARRRR